MKEEIVSLDMDIQRRQKIRKELPIGDSTGSVKGLLECPVYLRRLMTEILREDEYGTDGANTIRR